VSTQAIKTLSLDRELPPDTVSEAMEPIAGLLVKSGFLTPEQLRYGRRIQGKLASPKPLLRVLEDLRYVTRDQIQRALQASEVRIPLGALLLELGLIRESDLKSALALQSERPGKRLGQILADNHFLEEKALIEMFSLQLGYPRLCPNAERLDPELMNRAPPRWFRQNEFIPLNRRDDRVVVAFVYPLDPRPLEAAHKLFGGNLIIGIARLSEITEALDRYEAGRMKGPSVVLNDSVIILTVNQMINDAADANASDIHIEPMKDRLRIRFRQDGVLTNYKDFPKDLIPPLTSRIKIMASADIAEKRRHQNGRILFDCKGLAFDIRLSTYVSMYSDHSPCRCRGAQVWIRLAARSEHYAGKQSGSCLPGRRRDHAGGTRGHDRGLRAFARWVAITWSGAKEGTCLGGENGAPPRHPRLTYEDTDC